MQLKVLVKSDQQLDFPLVRQRYVWKRVVAICELIERSADKHYVMCNKRSQLNESDDAGRSPCAPVDVLRKTRATRRASFQISTSQFPGCIFKSDVACLMASPSSSHSIF